MYIETRIAGKESQRIRLQDNSASSLKPSITHVYTNRRSATLDTHAATSVINIPSLSPPGRHPFSNRGLARLCTILQAEDRYVQRLTSLLMASEAQSKREKNRFSLFFSIWHELLLEADVGKLAFMGISQRHELLRSGLRSSFKSIPKMLHTSHRSLKLYKVELRVTIAYKYETNMKQTGYLFYTW